jgi:hypothetical protein
MGVGFGNLAATTAVPSNTWAFRGVHAVVEDEAMTGIGIRGSDRNGQRYFTFGNRIAKIDCDTRGGM